MGLTGFNLRRRARAKAKAQEALVEKMEVEGVETDAPAFEDMTKEQLLAFADGNGVEVSKTLKKAEIVEAIKTAMEG